jgi:glucose/arabinose dehydrogenase
MPDGAMLYTERGRGLSVRRANGTTALLFRPNDFVAQGQSGMQGVAIDPAFATNRTLYVYMSSNASGTSDNRVIRFTVDAGYTTVSNRSDIVTGISFKNTWLSNDPSGAGAHSGGRIRFGPDGFLYITTGDNHSGPLPQNLNALGARSCASRAMARRRQAITRPPAATRASMPTASVIHRAFRSGRNGPAVYV